MVIPIVDRRGQRRLAMIVALVLLLVTGHGIADQGSTPCGEAMAACAADPTALLETRVYRDLATCRSEVRGELMARLVRDPAQPWGIRARAVTMLSLSRDGEAWEVFQRDFRAVAVAARPDGAEAIDFLAGWLPRVGDEAEVVEQLLLPGADRSGVDDVLRGLAGQPVHDYLRLLYRSRYELPPEAVRALSETDDQDTRRFLLWYVGERGMVGMEGLLVRHIASNRPSTYPSQARRTFEALFTAGLSELIRAAERVPPWLGPESTPKGMALQSLQRLLPPGAQLGDRALVEQLLAASAANAAGRDRGQWRLAADILLVLGERRHELGQPGAEALALLARHSLRKRGPLEALSLTEEIHRRTGTALPALTAVEQGQLWDITLTTLDARFVGAVVRAFPDPERERELRDHLLGQEEQAARGTLRVVRCWGADLHGPGEWCECVAELGLGEAVGGVERVLESAWADEAALALTRLGADGTAALTRFLVGPSVTLVKGEVRLEAVRHCARQLDPDAARSLLRELRDRPATAEAARQVGRELLSRPQETE